MACCGVIEHTEVSLQLQQQNGCSLCLDWTAIAAWLLLTELSCSQTSAFAALYTLLHTYKQVQLQKHGPWEDPVHAAFVKLNSNTNLTGAFHSCHPLESLQAPS